MQRILIGLVLLLSFLAVATAKSPQSFAVALLKAENASPNSYLASNRFFSYFVTVGGHDLSSGQIRALSETGLSFQPGSVWTPGAGMRLDISAPIPTKNGDYSVTSSYYCGPTCGATVVSVMRRAKTGWLLVFSNIQVLSFRDAPNKSFKPNLLRRSA